MKNILITGAAGFLGSHLVDYHLNAGDDVVGVDNFCSSSPESTHHVNLISKKEYDFTDVDISTERFFHIFSGKKFDIIYNFACPASPPAYQNMPVATTMTCVAGTNYALKLANKSTVFVQASTSEIYGDPCVSPQSETYRGRVNSYGPRACYDEGKRAAEALCYDYLNKHSIDARVVRIFNTYGPRMNPDDGRVITNLVGQALKGEPMTIYGNGSQTRSFCYVDDLIRGIIAMGSLTYNPRTPINLGNPNEFAVIRLAEKIKNKIGGTFQFKDLPVDDPMQRKPDIALANKILGWEPVVGLDEGLDSMIKYMKGAL